MFKAKFSKRNAIATSRKLQQDHLFFPIEGKLTEAQLEGIAGGGLPFN